MSATDETVPWFFRSVGVMNVAFVLSLHEGDKYYVQISLPRKLHILVVGDPFAQAVLEQLFRFHASQAFLGIAERFSAYLASPLIVPQLHELMSFVLDFLREQNFEGMMIPKAWNPHP